MTFWLVTSALAAAVAVLIALALLRRRGGGRDRAEYDIAVYRDQLASVETDLARGVIGDDAAERTRTEIARRILDADRARPDEAHGEAPRWLSFAAAGAVAVLLIGGGATLYLREGVPGYGDLPLKTRLAASAEFHDNRPSQAEAEKEAAARAAGRPAPDPRHVQLVEKLRKAMEERPDDPRGFQLLAQNEAALGNFSAARAAQERLIALKGDAATAEDYADYADILVTAAGGYVSPEAEAALGQTLKRAPTNGVALYYLGAMELQIGRPDRAFRIWRSVLENSPADAPWVAPIEAQIADAAARAGVDYTPAPAEGAPRGPSAADMQAAGQMTPEARAEMIRNMVADLSERLDSQGGTPAEWAQLISALGVLGESEQATAALDEAQKAYAGNDAALAQIGQAAARAGLTQ